MSEVTIEENTTKRWTSSTFNFKIESNGYSVDILYKLGLIPTYQRSLSVSADDLPQLIDALQGMHKVLNKQKDQGSRT